MSVRRRKGMPKAAPNKTKPSRDINRKRAFDAQAFLDSAGVSRKVEEFTKKETIFSQGDPGTTVFYIQRGGVRLSVVNEAGKEAGGAVLGPGACFGEGRLAGPPARGGTGTSVPAPTALR